MKLELLFVAPRVIRTFLSLRSPNVVRASEFDRMIHMMINITLNDISRRNEDHKKAVYKILSAESEGIK